MTLIVDKLPQYPIIFTGNPTEIALRKVGINAQTGGYSYLILSFDMSGSGPSVGQTLILDFAGGNPPITFTFVASETDDATQLAYYPGGDITAYGKLLANDIYRHPLINAGYKVNFLGYLSFYNVMLIQIIARERGADYNITLDASSTVTTAPSGYPNITQTYANDDAPLSDYEIIARASFVLDSFYNPVVIDADQITATAKIDNDTDEGIATLHDLPQLADGMLGVDIPDNPWIITMLRRSFAIATIEVTEQYDTGFSLVVNLLQNTTVYKKTMLQMAGDLEYPSSAGINGNPCLNFIVLKGGSQLPQYPFDINFFNWVNNDGAFYFLSLQPSDAYGNRSKLIDTNSPEWLSFCNMQGIYVNGCYVQFQIFYSDGTNATQNVDAPIKSVVADQLFIMSIPTGWVQNNLGAVTPSKTPLYYTVGLYNSSNSLRSEIFTYILDTRFFRDLRYFIYQNSLGQIDTLRCVGVQQYSIARNSTTRERALLSTDRGRKGRIEMVYNELTLKWTMRTGWLLSRDEKESLTDFLRSNYVAEVIPTLIDGVPTLLFPPGSVTDMTSSTVPVYYKQPYRSCIIDTSSITMYSWDDDTWGLQWDMYYANKEINYSNIISPPDLWFDTLLDFTVTCTALADGDGTLEFYADQNLEIYLNGILQTVTTFDIGLGSYRFQFKGATTTILQITASNMLIDLTISNLEMANMYELALIGFYSINDDYLCNRLTQFQTLGLLTISTSNDPGFAIDKMLAVYSNAIQAGNAPLMNELNFPHSTPSATGILIADYLINVLGITVITA